ncbi:MAG: hypothetical protein IT457_25230 [Planctomycetes bacterium]|nr:hypothetical protein [Planctomycetota bacterium]
MIHTLRAMVRTAEPDAAGLAPALRETLPVEPDTLGTRGCVYTCWRALRPLLSWLIRWRQGEGGLQPPRRDDPDHEWWWLTLYRATRRVVDSGTGSISTWVFGVASLLLSVALACPWTWLRLVLAILLVPALGLTIVYSAYLALRAQAPQQFANTLLNGRSTPESIKVTAYHVRALCRHAEHHIAALDAFLRLRLAPAAHENQDDSAATDSMLRSLESEAPRLRNLLRACRRGLVRDAEQVRRVRALKDALAERLRVPPNRLRDHLLQFSVPLFASRIAKYVDNWQTLLQAAAPTPAALDPELRVRLGKLIRQNRRIGGELAARIRVQDQFLAPVNEPLLAPLARMASMHSTSGSIVQYAWLIAAVANAARRAFETGFGDDASADEPTAKTRRDALVLELAGRAHEVLGFLRRKHRAYPGIELHGALLRLCTRAGEASASDPSRARTWQVAREALAAIGHAVPAWLPHHAEEFLETLGNLGLLVEGRVAGHRTAIVAQFVARAQELVQQVKGADALETLVVTSGYSKSVRQAVRELAKSGLRLRVFVLVADADEGGDETDDADARALVFELTEPHGEGLPRISVGRGPRRVLEGILQAEQMVFVLIGAECYLDAPPRVVHPRLGRDGFEAALQTIRATCPACRVIGLAETYKRIARLSDEEPVFRHHLDRLVVHDVDEIVTDEGSLLAPTTAPAPPAEHAEREQRTERRSEDVDGSDETELLCLAVRRVLVSVLAEPRAARRVLALVEELARGRGQEIGVAHPEADDAARRAELDAHHALLQVVVEPRPRGQRGRSQLEFERGLANGLGLCTELLEVESDERTWRAALDAALARLGVAS